MLNANEEGESSLCSASIGDSINCSLPRENYRSHCHLLEDSGESSFPSLKNPWGEPRRGRSPAMSFPSKTITWDSLSKPALPNPFRMQSPLPGALSAQWRLKLMGSQPGSAWSFLLKMRFRACVGLWQGKRKTSLSHTMPELLLSEALWSSPEMRSLPSISWSFLPFFPSLCYLFILLSSSHHSVHQTHTHNEDSHIHTTYMHSDTHHTHTACMHMHTCTCIDKYIHTQRHTIQMCEYTVPSLMCSLEVNGLLWRIQSFYEYWEY